MNGDAITRGNAGKPPKKSRWRWLLWWRVDQAELTEQLEGYDRLGLLRSARKLSVVLLTVSAAVTAAAIYADRLGASSYVDALLFVVLSAFVFFAHRWAMIAVMMLWTLEKGSYVYDSLAGAQPNGGGIAAHFLWWTTYMHAFYLAFRVEQERRRNRRTSKRRVEPTFR